MTNNCIGRLLVKNVKLATGKKRIKNLHNIFGVKLDKKRKLLVHNLFIKYFCFLMVSLLLK